MGFSAWSAIEVPPVAAHLVGRSGIEAATSWRGKREPSGGSRTRAGRGRCIEQVPLAFDEGCPMSVLQIFLFGAVRIEHDARPSPERVTRTVQALLAYLLLQRHRSHSRELLCGLFWDAHPEDKARGCLNTTLWRLRRVLEPDGVPRGTYLVTGANGEIGFNHDSDYWLDVAALEQGADRVLSRPLAAVQQADVHALEAALRLYTGELLEGNYSDWALRERERLRALHLNGLARLMRYHADHGAYEKSLVCGEKILAVDPLREEIHRAMMRLYLASGQRARAMRQYETCRKIIASELSVEPMEETQAAYSEVVAARDDLGQVRPLSNGFQTLQPVLERLHDALRGVEQARERCQRALQLVERLTQGPARKAHRSNH
jgi:DNA-binding SARP family transcriptional activator